MYGLLGPAPGDGEKSRPPDPAPAKQPLRPGLTAQQSQKAIQISGSAMTELRKKTEGAAEEKADKREFVVGIERMRDKSRSRALRIRLSSLITATSMTSR